MKIYPLATPPTIHKSVDVTNVAGGVVLGTGMSAQQKIDNGTLLNNALALAAANGWWVESSPGNVQVDAQKLDGAQKVGIQIVGGVSGVDLRGLNIYQYAVNHPILTIGHPSTRIYSLNAKLGSTAFGVDQVGNTAAVGVQLGALANCDLDINVGGYGLDGYHDPYYGVKSIAGTIWSNRYRMSVNGGQANLVYIDADGTGCHWENCYFGGHRSGLPFTSGGLYIKTQEQNVFNQCNIEWIIGQALTLDNAKGQVFNSLHLEGIKMTAGANPAFIRMISSEAIFNGLELFEPNVQAATGFTGTAALFNQYAINHVTIDGFHYRQQTVSNDVDWALFNHRTDDTSSLNSGGFMSTFEVRNIRTDGSHRMVLDPTLPKTLMGSKYIGQAGRYTFNYGIGRSEQMVWDMAASGTETAYMCHRDQIIQLNLAIAADKTLVLSNKLAASGIGSTVQAPAGTVVVVRRGPGSTGAFNLKVMQSDGVTLIENIAANASNPGNIRKYILQADGLWVAYA